MEIPMEIPIVVALWIIIGCNVYCAMTMRDIYELLAAEADEENDDDV